MEVNFDVPAFRKGHRVDLGESTCYWFEMPHDGPDDSLLRYFDLYLNQYNWDKFIRPGCTVIDVGGFTGDTTIPMQFLARSTVLAVEPNPGIRPYLEFNCSVNAHLGKFVVASEAVTTEDVESLEIFDHNNNLCNGGIIDESWTDELKQRMIGMSAKQVTVQGLTLEHMCEKYLTEEEINNIGFIKTDTEGHDISILRSSKDLIERLKPVIFIEWFFAYTDVETREMFNVIEELGYAPFYPTTLMPATIDQRSEDLLLIHKSKIGEYF